jgi:cyclase
VKRIRIIPSLLLHKNGLIKSIRFKDYKYIGDPINAVRIFNDKEVDELAIIDIDATRDKRPPDFGRVAAIVSEAFMPIAYGGGITRVVEAEKILSNGAEKVIINKAAVTNMGIVGEVAKRFGSQSVMVSIDYGKTFWGSIAVFTDNGKINTHLNPEEFAKRAEEAGAGEILLNAIDRDGTFKGYDLMMIKRVSGTVSIPVIAIGGAASIIDFKLAVQHGASAVGAGSMFVFRGPHRAVLISYPTEKELEEAVYSAI